MGELNLERSKVKFDLWERKLLDLSTRNSLLNLRIKGSSIPLFVPGCANIEDLIAQDKNFTIISRGEDEEPEEEETASQEPEAKDAADTAARAEGTEPAQETAEEKPVQEAVPEAAPIAAPEVAPVAAPDAVAEAAPDAVVAKEPAKESKKIKGVPAKDYSIEDLADITEFKEFIYKKYEKGTLVSSLTNAVLDKNIKTLTEKIDFVFVFHFIRYDISIKDLK